MQACVKKPKKGCKANESQKGTHACVKLPKEKAGEKIPPKRFFGQKSLREKAKRGMQSE